MYTRNFLYVYPGTISIIIMSSILYTICGLWGEATLNMIIYLISSVSQMGKLRPDLAMIMFADNILTLLSGVTALAIGIFLGLRYLDIKDRLVLYMSISFLLIGIGIILEPATTMLMVKRYIRHTAIIEIPATATIRTLWITSLILQIIGFLGIIASYYRTLTPRDYEVTLSALGIAYLGIIGAVPYLILLILASYLSSITLSRYILYKTKGNLIIFIGFTALMLSYIMIILSLIEPYLSIGAELSRFIGYILMLVIFITPPEEK